MCRRKSSALKIFIVLISVFLLSVPTSAFVKDSDARDAAKQAGSTTRFTRVSGVSGKMVMSARPPMLSRDRERNVPEYAPDQMIVEYELKDPTETKGRAIQKEHEKLTDAIRKMLPQEIRIKSVQPVHKALVEQMVREDKSETKVFKEMLLKRAAVKKLKPQQVKTIPPHAYDLSQKLLIKLDNPKQDVMELINYLNDPKNQPKGYKRIEARPNYIYEATFIPNDPRFSEQWGLHNTGQTGGTPDADIDAPEAWDTHQGSPDTIIAVIDTGVDYNHQDLAQNIWINQAEIPNNGIDDDNNGYVDDVKGYDFVLDASWSGCASDEDCSERDNNPMDVMGHGTHVSGIAAGGTNNNIGIAGVCPNCKIMALRAGFKTSDGNGSLFDTDIASAIEYATMNGADVINMSFGGHYTPGYFAEIRLAHDAEIVLVAAAGNDNSGDVFQPAATDEVIAVAAMDFNNQRSIWSGPYASNYGPWIVVAAPGTEILSTLPNNSYDSWNGTSMACPYVAGLAGLIRSVHPEFSPLQVRNVLRSSADDIVDPDWDIYSGYGRINAQRALTIDSASNGIAKITSPQFNSEVFGVIDIQGTATDDDFSSYAVYFKDENNWQEICTSTSSVESGTLCSSFDTTLANEGTVFLKLVVSNANQNTSEDIVSVTVNNIEITNPLNNDVLRAGDTINIEGQIKFDFSSYEVEYGIGRNPTEWFSTGIVVTGQSNGLLATWDTTQFIEPNFFAIRLIVHKNGTQRTELAKDIYLDPTLKAGWPKKIPFEPQPWWGGLLVPIVTDIDRDGQKEIIVYIMNNPPKLLVFRENGSLFWSAQIGNVETEGGGNYEIPLIGDIDKDGFDEIFVFHSNHPRQDNVKLYGFKYDGFTLGPNWPVLFPPFSDFIQPNMLMADLDLDDHEEIVIQLHSIEVHKMMVVSYDGNIISQWDLPNLTGVGPINSSPAIGNFDDDPELEIVAASSSLNAGREKSVICVYNMDGSIVAGWPVQTDGLVFSSPVVGDINGDGKEEIVVGVAGSVQGGIYVFDRNGDVLPGWPVERNKFFQSSPSLADANNDGFLEIVTSGLNNSTYLIRHNGTIAENWPQNTGWKDYYGSIRGDINGDGVPDVITTAGDLLVNGGVYAWDVNGNLLPGFPKMTDFDAQAPAVIADLDGNGTVELIATSDWDYDFANQRGKNRGSIYVWELNAPYRPETMHWPTFQHDNQRTGRYRSLQPPGNYPPDLQNPRNQTVNEGEIKTFQLLAIDTVGDTFSFSLVEGPDFVSVDSRSGIVTLAPSSNSAGTYDNVKFRVTDQGNLSDDETIQIIVEPRGDSCILWVDSHAESGGNGSTEHPFNAIQNAIDAASPNCEIHVVQGVYKSLDDPSSARPLIHWVHNNNVMKDPIKLMGGFASVNGSRSSILYPTVIDGEGRDSATCIETYGLTWASEFSGFVVTHCRNMGRTPGYVALGGGMRNTQSSLTIKDCIFKENYGLFGGDAIFNHLNSAPTIINSIFVKMGGEHVGGGGVIYNESSHSIIINSTFSQNVGRWDGVIYNGASNPIITNTIIWGNEIDSIRGFRSNPIVSYSLIQGGYAGEGNLDQDPLFIDPANGDFHLREGSPAIDHGTANGAPPADIEGTPRPQGEGIDIGAYERSGGPAMCTSDDDCVNIDDLCQRVYCSQSTHQCVSELLNCDDNNPCTADSCNPTAGCRHEPILNCSGQVFVKVELSPTLHDPNPNARGDTLTRCITFDLYDQRGNVTEIQKEVVFPVDQGRHHRAKVALDTDGSEYACMTARDRLHTLSSTAAVTRNAENSSLSANFTGEDNWLVGGDLDGDGVIDIRDFGLVVNRNGTDYGTGNTTCSTPPFHADVSGDGRVSEADVVVVQNNFLKRSDPVCRSPRLPHHPRKR